MNLSGLALWPILLAITAELVYNIAAKSLPGRVNSFAALTGVYLVAAVISFVLYEVETKGGNIFHEYAHMNASPLALGLAIIGLETGMIFMYRVGWPMQKGFLIFSILSSVVIILAGYLLYDETITLSQTAGIILCLAGIVLTAL
ncbi:MAG: EamA family transporter [Dialister sp.]|nr:EamA family transporter [Dialister sp.]